MRPRVDRSYMILTFIFANFTPVPCSALSTSTRNPWSASEWMIRINFGKESSTEMPIHPKWGESGARLVLPVPVLIESDAIERKSIDTVIGNGAMLIKPTGFPVTYINLKGEQSVAIDDGGWKIDLPRDGGRKGLASTLKVCLDLRTKLERNDVIISPDRLYLFAPCWREEEYRRGKTLLVPIVAAAQEAQRVVDEQLSHDSGDRRLDGIDPIETALAYKDMALLVADRDEMKRRRREAEKVYPRDKDKMILGAWPGTTEPLAIGRGMVLIKKKKLFGVELQVVGRWDAVPVVNPAIA